MRIKFFRTKFSFRKSIKLILLLINSRNFRKSEGKYFILFFKRKKKTARVRSMKRFFMNVMFDQIVQSRLISEFSFSFSFSAINRGMINCAHRLP